MPARDLTLQRMQSIMRLNDWQHDPISGGDPGNQLSGVSFMSNVARRTSHLMPLLSSATLALPSAI